MKNITVVLFVGIIFFACSKNNNKRHAETIPTVNYTLQTHFRGQDYLAAHSSVSHFLTDDPVEGYLWDNGSVYGSSQACEALELISFNTGSISTYYRIEMLDSPAGVNWPTRPILIFSISSLNSVASYTDTAVSINIKDTTYTGHADVSFTITDRLNTQTLGKYVSGNFSMSGKVSNGAASDSISFSTTGTFTNLPDIP